MKHLVIDGMLHGTGIRDQIQGGYVNPEDLRLSSSTIERLNKWLLRYEHEHYDEYKNKELIGELDVEGKELVRIIKKELTEIKMEYYSSALMKKEIIE